jgi:hypothetical protein
MDRRSIAFYSLKDLFNSSFIPAYQTTIRTSTNGIAAERYIKRRVTADEAAPVKYPIHTMIRNRVVSVGHRNLCLAYSVTVKDFTIQTSRCRLASTKY